MKRILFVVLAVLLLASLAGAACSAPAPTTAPATTPVGTMPTTTTPPSPQPQQTFTWKLQSNYQSASQAGKSAVAWANWVKQATRGRVTVNFFEPGAIVSIADTLSAVGKGTVECAYNYGAYTTLPVGQVEAGLAMGPRNIEEVWDLWFNRGFFDLIKKAYAEQNIYFVSPLFLSDPYNMAFNMPVKSLADVKGKKVRAIGQFGELISAVGGSPVSLPFGEVYMAAKLGTIDGMMTCPLDGLIEYKHSEVVKYMFEGSLNLITDDVIVNMDAWKALPADIQDVLSRDSVYVLLNATISASWQVEKAEVQSTTLGVTFVPYTADDWATLQQAALGVWDKLAAKDAKYSAPAIEMARQQQRDLGRLK